MKTKTLVMLAYVLTALFILLSITQLVITTAYADVPGSWNAAKRIARDQIYGDLPKTFYCGCAYTPHRLSKPGGGGKVAWEACGYESPTGNYGIVDRLDWEHVVPASLTPVRQMACWIDHDRDYCEANSEPARRILYDLHNLVPSIGQVNIMRSNDRYGLIPAENRKFGSCPIEDQTGLFEPGDDERGDAARIWFYMNWKYGVEIPKDELVMFREWHEADPVSDWEIERDQRIEAVQGNSNPWVKQ